MLNYDSRRQTGRACSLPGLGFFPMPRTMERPLFHHRSVRTTCPSRRMGFPITDNGGLVVEASSMVQIEKKILRACCFGQNKKLLQLFTPFESIKVNRVDFLTLGDEIWKATVPCPIHHGPNRRNLTAKAYPASPA